jgi:phosphopantetheinyl transferase
MRLAADSSAAGASLLGIALARRLLGEVHAMDADSVRLRFPYQAKPYCLDGADFSISHSGGWVAALVCASTRVGLDVEVDTAAGAAAPRGDLCDWTAREAMLKACGASLQQIRDFQVGDCYCRWKQQRWPLLRPPAPAGLIAAIVSEQPVAVSLREFAWQTLAGQVTQEASCA